MGSPSPSARDRNGPIGRMRSQENASSHHCSRSEESIETNCQSRCGGDLFNREQDSWHKRSAVIRILADRQTLSECAKDDLLMGNKSTETDRVDKDICLSSGSACSREDLALGG